jgi:ElaB/YqjD/DUF883 family membrane-anchored ribosome-binding protein
MTAWRIDMNAPLATAHAGYDVGRAKRTVGPQFEELFDGVDDLIKRVADTENPEIRKIRAKVHASMMAAKIACEGGTHTGANTVNEESPEEALGVVFLVGLGVIMSIHP